VLRRALIFRRIAPYWPWRGAVFFGLASRPDRDRRWHPPRIGVAAPRVSQHGYGAASGRASQVRGKPKTNVVVMVVGRVVVAVGRAQVDRSIVPAAAAPSRRSAGL